MNTKSQRDEILGHLLTGKAISPLEALEKFGCFRLGGRIFELRQQGYRIKTETVKKNGKAFASYSLEK
jgi:hypothetical protein